MTVRRPQFGLKTLLWLMLLVASVCGLATFLGSRDDNPFSHFITGLLSVAVAGLAIHRLAFPRPRAARASSAGLRIIEARIDEQGRVQLRESVVLTEPRRALVTVFDEPPRSPNETELLSEAVLGKDWNRPEQDAAWSYLQPGK